MHEIGHELGYFGNIWVRQNVLAKAGDKTNGHLHLFDHVSLLAKGKVEVQVEGHPPRVFTAPTFIVIKKENRHSFTALEDDCLWYCVFAIRDVDGDISDIVPETSLPYFIQDVADDYWERRIKLENLSIDVPKSWRFDNNQNKWVAPKPYPPTGKLYEWSEEKLDWVLL